MPLFCSYHILTSSVICYWTDARQHGIYLLTILYSTLLYAMLYCTILYSTLLCSTLLYYILYYTILYYTILYSTILYYTILYYTILYYTILYYTILYSLTHSAFWKFFIKVGLNIFSPTSPAKYCFCPSVFSRLQERFSTKGDWKGVHILPGNWRSCHEYERAHDWSLPFWFHVFFFPKYLVLCLSGFDTRQKRRQRQKVRLCLADLVISS